MFRDCSCVCFVLIVGVVGVVFFVLVYVLIVGLVGSEGLYGWGVVVGIDMVFMLGILVIVGLWLFG